MRTLLATIVPAIARSHAQRQDADVPRQSSAEDAPGYAPARIGAVVATCFKACDPVDGAARETCRRRSLVRGALAKRRPGAAS